uniref:Rab-GAP TBC domain-containing protein n=1 Tax=Globisporangium ultimum (strain ATCC 200006 / CBS 805.95 / DAOM BR144) TaxID=431595 RepID=K3WBH4_GLOUD
MASGGRIDLDQLRDLVFQGIDASHELDCAADSVRMPAQALTQQSIRSIAWRILLGVLDTDPAQWATLVSEKRARYRDWKREFLGCRRQNVVRREKTPEHEAGTSATKKDSIQDEDLALLREIDKDVSRTQSSLPFFQIGGIAQQWMLRILFLYAKLHPALGYMQGMNEILAPIVFVYGTDPDDEWAEETETDAFFSFVTIMASVQLLYLKSPLDSTKSGVDTQMMRLTSLLRQHDALLWQHLNSIGLTPDLHSFRWYMTLLTREFKMSTTLRIWDSLLADSKRFGFLHYVSCALIRCERAFLLQNGFSQCLQVLQTLPDVHDIERVLLDAERMREKDRQTDQSRLQSATILK